MKYLLTVDYRGGTTDLPMPEWKPEEIKAHLDYHAALHRELAANGEHVDGHMLTDPELAKVVTSDGTVPVATDGPFAGAKEMLAGFQLIDVDSEARAIEIAGRVSQAPGPGGTPLRQPIGVRRVMSTTDAEPL
ncbi:YciI family protein [Actinoplanes sp. NPDC051346]|uniref:YciI family protein n=1 Tax=Actinoplanes sp. NPDC051346 TaxID=3155048 RepID=UPI003413CBD2